MIQRDFKAVSSELLKCYRVLTNLQKYRLNIGVMLINGPRTTGGKIDLINLKQGGGGYAFQLQPPMKVAKITAKSDHTIIPSSRVCSYHQLPFFPPDLQTNREMFTEYASLFHLSCRYEAPSSISQDL